MDTITDDADRDALLRYVDLIADIGDLVNRYLDLGPAIVAHALQSRAHEALACAYLPQKWRPRPPDEPADRPREADDVSEAPAPK